MNAIHILVDEAYWPQLDDVAGRLAARGFVLEQKLEAIGVLTGSAEAEHFEALRNEAGVRGLELVRTDFGAI